MDTENPNHRTTEPPSNRPTGQPDSDDHLGAVEGDRAADPQQGNRNATGLDERGLPKDRKRICEDVIGANVDESQG
jgi:hypothetical protein